VALAGKLISFCTTRSSFFAAKDLVLLLRDDACEGEPQGIVLKMNWLGRIKMSQHGGLVEGVT
jgi:hypothetical protein